MSKNKKMLLISYLILLASCGPSIPEPPEASKVAPIWRDGRVSSFYGRWMKSGEKIHWSLSEGREVGLICTDTDSYARQEFYLKQMRELAKKRCK